MLRCWLGTGIVTEGDKAMVNKAGNMNQEVSVAKGLGKRHWLFWLIIALHAPMVEADFSSAKRDFDKGNYASAFYEWRQLAEQGNAEAQYEVASMYESGVGVGANQEKARKWYQLSAEQGSLESQVRLGVLHLHGKLPDASDTDAWRWLSLAAEQGDPDAQMRFAMLLLEGKGGEVDEPRAAEMFKAAAEQGLSQAQNNLGSLYERGIGVTKDPEQAFEWYSKAARQGDKYAQNSLGALYSKGLGVERNNAWAVFWFVNALSNGNEQARGNIESSLGRLAEATVKGRRVNVRAGNSTNHDVITQLEDGASVFILGEQEGWSQVYIPQIEQLGWMSSSLLSKS